MKGLKHTDQRKGSYHKYRVERRDGSTAPGRKHARCAYFVLDLMHDEFAVAALAAYADSCQEKYPELAAELRSLDVGTSCSSCKGDGVRIDHRSNRSPCVACKGWGVSLRGDQAPLAPQGGSK